jgi:hypothetical protein
MFKGRPETVEQLQVLVWQLQVENVFFRRVGGKVRNDRNGRFMKSPVSHQNQLLR